MSEGNKSERDLKIASDALTAIRAKAHAHNRGGEMSRGLRNEIRDLCDLTFAKMRQPIEEAQKDG